MERAPEKVRAGKPGAGSGILDTLGGSPINIARKSEETLVPRNSSNALGAGVAAGGSLTFLGLSFNISDV